MIPILYQSTETEFTTNGLGRLSDVISCNVEEERNGAYELTMQYPVDGNHFADISLSKIITAIPADGKPAQPFRIYYISKPMSGTVEIKAEHISYQLSHIPVQPFEAGSAVAAMAGLKTYSAEANPFTFWTDKSTVANFKVNIPSSIRSLLGGTEGSVLDTFGGGEYEFDKYTVKLHNARGSDNGVSLKYGKNITDIRQEENIANTYTGVYPYWLGTNDASEEVLVTLTEKVLHSANAQNFPYQRTIPLDLSSEFQTQPTEAQLRARAQAYMTANNIGVPTVSIDVNFVALWQTEEYKQFANLERVNLCDTVTVEFPVLGISAKAKVVKTNYDVLKERYNSIEVGDARTNFANQISRNTAQAVNSLAKRVPSKTSMQQAIDHATQLITGGLGGHVVFTLNADGEPQEILVMDTDDIQTAVNVIRINANGIGFSTTGYNGTYTTAWTIDGHFVADFIDTGILTASLIKTGVLQDTGGNFILDLATGTLTMKKGSINIGNGVFVVGTNGAVTATNFTATSSTSDGFAKISNAQFLTGYNNTAYLIIYSSASESAVGAGIRAKNLSSNRALGISSNTGVVIEGNTRVFLSATGSNNNMQINSTATTVNGTFWVIGEKNRAVKTEDYSVRRFSAYESSQPMFADIGEGIIGEDGKAYIYIDPIFLQSVDISGYNVFLQKYGDGDAYVFERNPAYFIVKGTPNMKFAWELKAKQNLPNVARFSEYIEDSNVIKPEQYADKAIEHLQELYNGRVSA